LKSKKEEPKPVQVKKERIPELQTLLDMGFSDEEHLLEVLKKQTTSMLLMQFKHYYLKNTIFHFSSSRSDFSFGRNKTKTFLK